MSLFAMLTTIGTCPGCKTGTTRMAAFLRIIDCDDRVRICHGLIADVQYLECSDVDQSRQIRFIQDQEDDYRWQERVE
jgi:hypothetical protein